MDDNTPFATCDSIYDVIKTLENDSIKLFKWFSDNKMKGNKDKCHLLMSTNENSNITIVPSTNMLVYKTMFYF